MSDRVAAAHRIADEQGAHQSQQLSVQGFCLFLTTLAYLSDPAGKPVTLRCFRRSTAPIAAACCRSLTLSAALSCAAVPPGAFPRLLALFGLRGEDVAEATEVLLFKDSNLGGPGSLPGTAWPCKVGELCKPAS